MALPRVRKFLLSSWHGDEAGRDRDVDAAVAALTDAGFAVRRDSKNTLVVG